MTFLHHDERSHAPLSRRGVARLLKLLICAATLAGLLATGLSIGRSKRFEDRAALALSALGDAGVLER